MVNSGLLSIAQWRRSPFQLMAPPLAGRWVQLRLRLKATTRHPGFGLSFGGSFFSTGGGGVLGFASGAARCAGCTTAGGGASLACGIGDGLGGAGGGGAGFTATGGVGSLAFGIGDGTGGAGGGVASFAEC